MAPEAPPKMAPFQTTVTYVMNDRLQASKKEFLDQMDREGFALGVSEANESWEYGDLVKLQSSSENSKLDSIRDIAELFAWDEHAILAYTSEDNLREHPAFVRAYVRGLISVLDCLD